MPNTLTLATPIAIPNLTRVRIDKLLDVDESAGALRLRLSVEGPGGRVYGSPFVQVTNGSAQGVRAKPSPSTFDDYVETFTRTAADDAAIATAFDSCLAAYKGGGRNGLLSQLQTLGLLPAGTVS